MSRYKHIPSLKELPKQPPNTSPNTGEIFKQVDQIFDEVADILQNVVDNDLWPEIDIKQNYGNLLNKSNKTKDETKKVTNNSTHYPT